jgi:hypothetical protein
VKIVFIEKLFKHFNPILVGLLPDYLSFLLPRSDTVDMLEYYESSLGRDPIVGHIIHEYISNIEDANLLIGELQSRMGKLSTCLLGRYVGVIARRV